MGTRKKGKNDARNVHTIYAEKTGKTIPAELINEEGGKAFRSRGSVVGVGLAKTRPPPKPARENPAHGPGWVLVSKPVGGLSSGKPNPRPKWVPAITQKSKKS